MAEPAPTPTTGPGRRRAAPVILVGLLSTALGAVAANQTWMSISGSDPALAFSAGVEPPQVPLSFTLPLVALATWGVVLVTRGRVRRAVAVLGLLAVLGSLVSTTSAWWQLRDSLRTDLATYGAPTGAADVTVSPWYPAALVLGVLALAPAVVAVLRVGSWVEMGARYDTPTGAPTGHGAGPDDGADLGSVDNLDLWKSLDRGDDPTA